jgi:hypothetical protein
MPHSFPAPEMLRKLWGSQSWLPPALSRRSARSNDPKKLPERRLQARLPAPRFLPDSQHWENYAALGAFACQLKYYFLRYSEL